MSRPTTGIRSIEDVEGGLIAWLYGPTDLDDVLLELVRQYEAEHEPAGVATSLHRAIGPEPCVPGPFDADDPENQAAWQAYRDHLPPLIAVIDEDLSTMLPGGEIVDVGYYRRMPWCHCGDGHAWHFEPSGPGPGASLAVVVSSW